MIRNFLETIQIRRAVREHNTKHRKRVLTVMPSGAELDAIEAFRNLGAQTNFPARLRQAAQLEAFGVTEPVLNVCLRIQSQGAITGADLNYLAHHGIKLGFSNHLNEVAETSEKLVRLQRAVKQLALIAGPGFTTDHLIDEGIIHEGDI